MIRTLRLSAEIVDRLGREASGSYPGEACGFLVGVEQGPVAVASGLRLATNRASRPDRYTIEALEVYEALRDARRDGADLLGVYHSHPDASPDPSATDAAEAWGGWLHLIVGCDAGDPGELRCWRWEASRFVPVEVDVSATGTGE